MASLPSQGAKKIFTFGKLTPVKRNYLNITDVINHCSLVY